MSVIIELPEPIELRSACNPAPLTRLIERLMGWLEDGEYP